MINSGDSAVMVRPEYVSALSVILYISSLLSKTIFIFHLYHLQAVQKPMTEKDPLCLVLGLIIYKNDSLLLNSFKDNVLIIVFSH